MRTPAAPLAAPSRARTRRALAVALLLALLLAAAPAPAPVAAVGCTVTSTADSGGGTLRAALALASCDTIGFTLPGSAPWTINLASTLPTISRPLTLTGPGQANLTIQPNPAIATANRFLLLFVDAHTAPGTPGMAVGISGLTLAGGRAKPQLGGNYGGNLRSYRANLTLTDVTLKDASGAADSGGAGAYIVSGTSTLTRVTISGNATGGATYDTGAGCSSMSSTATRA